MADLTLNFRVNDAGSSSLQKATGAIEGLKKSISMIQTSAFVYLGKEIINVTKAAYAFAETGAKVKSIEESFRLMAQNSGVAVEGLIGSLEKATNATVDQTDLMIKATRLMSEGFSSDQIVKVAEASRVAARLMATDVGSAYEKVSDAIVNLRMRGLKTAGIVIDQEAAYAKQAKTLGITKDALSDYGKQMALVDAVYEKSIELQKKFGDQATSEYEKMQQLSAEWQHFSEVISKLASTGWSEAMDEIKRYILSVYTPLAWVYDKLAGIGDVLDKIKGKSTSGDRAIQAQYEAQDMMVGAGKGVSEADKERMKDKEKLIELDIKRQKAIVDSNNEYAKMTGWIDEEIRLVSVLGKAELARLQKEAILNKELENAIKRVNEEKKNQLRNKKLEEEIKPHVMMAEETLGAIEAGTLADAETNKAYWADKIKFYDDISTREAEYMALMHDRGPTDREAIEIFERQTRASDELGMSILRLSREYSELTGNTQEQVELDRMMEEEYIRMNKIYGEQADLIRAIGDIRRREIEATQNLLSGLGKNLADEWSTAMSRVLTGQEKFSDAMKNLWTDLAAYVIQQSLRMFAMKALYGDAAGQGSLGGATSWVGGAVKGIGSILGALGGTTSPVQLGQYQGGTEYVPKTGLYGLHKGEAVIPAEENTRGEGGNITIINYNQVNDPNTFVKLYGPVVKKLSEQSTIEAKRFNKGNRI